MTTEAADKTEEKRIAKGKLPSEKSKKVDKHKDEKNKNETNDQEGSDTQDETLAKKSGTSSLILARLNQKSKKSSQQKFPPSERKDANSQVSGDVVYGVTSLAGDLARAYETSKLAEAAEKIAEIDSKTQLQIAGQVHDREMKRIIQEGEKNTNEHSRLVQQEINRSNEAEVAFALQEKKIDLEHEDRQKQNEIAVGNLNVMQGTLKLQERKYEDKKKEKEEKKQRKIEKKHKAEAEKDTTRSDDTSTAVHNMTKSNGPGMYAGKKKGKKAEGVVSSDKTPVHQNGM